MSEIKKHSKELIIHEYSTQIEVSSDEEAFVYYDLAKECLNNNNHQGYDYYIQLAKKVLSSSTNEEIKEESKR
ncbi:MAG: hypothetical protein ACM3O4_05140 [Ignavibacteriales bacterium]